MTTFISFIVLLGVLVFVHELGHFLAARSVGMRVEKFYLGFNLFGLGLKKKWGDTEYGIGLFPLGGYVKVAGMIDESMDTESSGAPDEFQSKSPLQQIWFASAGVLMNLLLAVIIFTIITMKVGIGEAEELPVVGDVLEDYPAATLGIEPGDLILYVNDIPVSTWEEMTDLIQPLENEPVFIRWEHNGAEFGDSVMTRVTRNFIDGEMKDVGMIGISRKINIRPASFVESVQEGFYKTWYWLMVVVKSLGMLISGGASMDEVGGPLMIAKLAGESARSGMLTFFNFMAIISVNLALLNILPFPALDGGHIIVSAVEGIIRRKLSTRVKMGIQQVGVFFLMLLFAFVLFNDISRFFR